MAAIAQGEGLIGRALGSLMKDVSQTITDAVQQGETAGINLEVEASRQVAIGVQNMQNAYQKSFDKTAEEVGQVAAKQINDLTVMVQGIQDHDQDIINGIESKIQQMILTMPFVGGEPQVRKVLPKYVVIGAQTADFVVSFDGLFKWASREGFTPTLTLGETQFTPENGTQLLSFRIPVGTMTALMKNCSYLLGSLQAPWDAGWIRTDKKVDTFNIWIGALPLSPGDIKVQYVKTEAERITRDLEENHTITLDPGLRSKKVVLMTQPGWHLFPGSSHLGITNNQNGACGMSLPTEFDDRVEYTITINPNVPRASPNFNIGFTEYQDVEETVKTREESADLRWGGSVALLTNPGERVQTIGFTPFDAPPDSPRPFVVFTGADVSNQYVKVIDEDGTLRLVATVPQGN
jgi:hypothetical protein